MKINTFISLSALVVISLFVAVSIFVSNFVILDGISSIENDQTIEDALKLKNYINYCEKELCFWRVHGSSLTWTKKIEIQKEYEQFLQSILKKYPELIDHKCIKKIEAKISYHQFFNEWNTTKFVNRSLLIPYLFIDKRLIFIYILSFLGFENFNRILRLIGKNV